MYCKFKALEDYIEDMKSLLKPYSRVLDYESQSFFSPEAIREYINLKGIPDYSEFLTSRYEEFEVSLSNPSN